MKDERKELAKYIENFMARHDYKLEYIAEQTGASTSAVGHYKTGTRTPKDDFIDKFIEVFHLGEEESQKIKMAVAIDRTPEIIKEQYMKSNVRLLPEETLINIPVMAKASAGNGYLNFSNQPLYNKLIRKNGFHEHCYLIEVSGNSMEPLIQDGAYVVVDPYQTDYIEGKVYVLKYADEVYIKRVILKSEAKVMILKSINPDYEDIYIPADQSDQIKIIGRAVKFIYEGNL